jgi:hypothetical protein
MQRITEGQELDWLTIRSQFLYRSENLAMCHYKKVCHSKRIFHDRKRLIGDENGAQDCALNIWILRISKEAAEECQRRIKNYRALQRQLDQLVEEALESAPWKEL